jgi:hypothetical protein
VYQLAVMAVLDEQPDSSVTQHNKYIWLPSSVIVNNSGGAADLGWFILMSGVIWL